MQSITPTKLQKGDRIHIVAPSRSLTALSKTELERQNTQLAIQRLESLGLRVTLGEHIYENDLFDCPSVEKRVEGLHEAFRDPDVKALLTVIGGWNGNYILDELDYDLIRANPKIFCGYSDITVFNNAFLARSGLLNYSGPHFSTFGMRDGIDYTLEGLRRSLFSSEPYELLPSPTWSEDMWFLDQDDRHFMENPGYVALQPGEAQGKIIGGNLCTFCLLNGTPFQPSLADSLLFFEDLRSITEFGRQLQSVLHLPGGDQVRGLVIGRFPKATAITREQLDYLIRHTKQLHGKPVIYGADFGHTSPCATIPIGGQARIVATDASATIEILRH